jgi:hypothetical protein
MGIFLDATIAVPAYNQEIQDYDLECYKIKNLGSPSVQRILENIEEQQYLDIAKLGLLLVRDVAYLPGGGIAIMCKRVKSYSLAKIF